MNIPYDYTFHHLRYDSKLVRNLRYWRCCLFHSKDHKPCPCYINDIPHSNHKSRSHYFCYAPPQSCGVVYVQDRANIRVAAATVVLALIVLVVSSIYYYLQVQ